MQEFFEAIWHGEGIADGADLAEAIAGFAAVRPEHGDWHTACAVPGADPHVDRYPSFEAYLDNVDPSQTIAVTAAMIEAAVGPEPSGEHDGHVAEAAGGGGGEA
jgi:hypothetical protein